MSSNYGENYLNTIKTLVNDAFKTSKKVIQKTEATGDLIEKKIAGKIIKTNSTCIFKDSKKFTQIPGLTSTSK